MFDKIRPLGDRVLVRRKETEEKTESGLYIPESGQEKPQLGEVVSVGKGRRSTGGEYMPLDVKPGQTVYYGKYAGTEAGDKYLIIREDEILGVVE